MPFGFQLAPEIADVVGTSKSRGWQCFYDLDSLFIQLHGFSGIVTEQFYATDVHTPKHVSGDIEAASITVKTQPLIGFEGIKPFILPSICEQFIEEANAPTLLPEVHDNPAVLLDSLDGFFELRTTVTAQRSKQISRHTLGMDADQGNLNFIPLAQTNSEVFFSIECPLKTDKGSIQSTH
jgi:hypothetical protein